MTHDERLLFLIRYLIKENSQYRQEMITSDKEQRFRLFRSLVNVRMPMPISEEFLQIQDEYLKTEIAQRGITDIDDLKPISDNIYLWKGDITSLKCGAVVNAANKKMMGCWEPCHICIDNCIHTFAGVQLRLECAQIMRKQGCDESTGQAKITSAYNLPCDHVIHTVGPIVSGQLTNEHCKLLESCYLSCLELAVQNQVESVAFCCISTGVFGFPQKEAAEIAVKTVTDFLKTDKRLKKVVFNVFKQEDYDIYKRLLE